MIKNKDNMKTYRKIIEVPINASAKLKLDRAHKLKIEKLISLRADKNLKY